MFYYAFPSLEKSFILFSTADLTAAISHGLISMAVLMPSSSARFVVATCALLISMPFGYIF